MNKATWVNGKRKLTGTWKYVYGSDRFVIWLDKRDSITGRDRSLIVSGYTPEWGNWKLVRGATDAQ